MTILKSHEKNVKIIFQWMCSEPKSEFWKDGYQLRYTGKNDGVLLLWGIFKEYLRQNIITAVVRKANAQSVVICGLIKKQ